MNESKETNTAIQQGKRDSEQVKMSEIRVSARTAKYILLKDKLVDLWNELYEALEEDYGAGASKMFDTNIEPHLMKVSDEIEAYMMVSINEVRNLKKGII